MSDSSADSIYRQVIAVTGGIGTGKSTFCTLLQKLGADVVSADELAREVVRPEGGLLAKISAIFSEDVLTPSGELDRKALAAKVFSEIELRAKLESLLHPAIAQLARSRFKEILDRKPKLLIYECPLLFEASLESNSFRAIICVTASEDQSIKRVLHRDSTSEDDVRSRMAAQLNLQEKAMRSDLVVENNGDLSDLEQKAKEIFEQFKMK